MTDINGINSLKYFSPPFKYNKTIISENLDTNLGWGNINFMPNSSCADTTIRNHLKERALRKLKQA